MIADAQAKANSKEARSVSLWTSVFTVGPRGHENFNKEIETGANKIANRRRRTMKQSYKKNRNLESIIKAQSMEGVMQTDMGLSAQGTKSFSGTKPTKS